MNASVVIPLFNKAPTVLRAVLSVRRQSRSPHEIIVVDDGSNDGGGALVAASFPEAVVVRQSNRGEGPARNAGVERATGDWIAFLDADDIWGATHLEVLAEAIGRSPEGVFAGTRASPRVRESRFSRDPSEALAQAERVLAEQRKRQRTESRRDAFAADYLALAAGRAAPVNASTVAVRRNRFAQEELRFPEAAVHADLAVWCRIALESDLILSPNVTVVTTKDASSVSERFRSAHAGSRQTDCTAYRGRADVALIEQALETQTLPEHRRRSAEAYLDGIVTRHWPTVLLYAEQPCARLAVESLRDPKAPRALLLRAVARIPRPVALLAATVLRRVVLLVGLSLPVSPFARRASV